MGKSGLLFVGLSVASLGPASAQTYTYGQPAFAVRTPSAWETYKVRLAALARQQGVREPTIQANVPGLTVNQRIIELERSEPIAAAPAAWLGRSHHTSVRT